MTTLTTRKRIALVSVHGDPAAEIGREEAGGQNVYVRQVGEALSRLGWQVDMFTRRSDPESPTIVEHNAHCRTIRLTAGPAEFIPRDQLSDYRPMFVLGMLAFQRQLGTHYSVVHTNYWHSAWVGMQLKRVQSVAQVHTYHSLGAVKYQSMPILPEIASHRLQVEQTCLATAERIIATSPQEAAHMRSFLSTQGAIDIIPCGTDVEHFGSISHQAARQALGIRPEEKVILYVGRFDPRKGIETLVRAVGRSTLRSTQPVRLIIGGGSRPGQSDGQERDRIGTMVADLGLAGITHFPGRLSPEELPTYYAAADICVVPSHYEPFGLVAIEAMACGTPVIGSDVGGLQYTIVPEKTGLLVPPQDELAWAGAIDRLLSQDEWRTQLGQQARQRVEQLFSWDGVAQQLSQVYLQVMEPQPVRELVGVHR